MEYKNDSVSSLSCDENKEHPSVHFQVTPKSNTINDNRKNYIKVEDIQKIEKMISDKLDKIERTSEKLKKKQEKELVKLEKSKDDLDKTEVLDLSELQNTSVIPSIPLDDYIKDKKETKVTKKESFFKRLFKKLFSKKDSKSIAVENKEDKMILKQEQKLKREEEKKIKIEEKRRIKEEKEILRKQKETERKESERIKKEQLREKEEKEKLIQKEKEEQKQHIKFEKQRQKEEKEAERKRIREEKLREKEEARLAKSNQDGVISSELSGLSTKGLKEEEKLRKEAEKKQRKEAQLAIKKEREARRKEELKLKYEQKAKEQLEKDKRKIELLQEKKEKKKKIETEKELARKERREKAKLIKKAEAESKTKAKLDRKTFEEKIKAWYENLSFVRDRNNRRELKRQTLLIDFEGSDAVRSDEKITYKYVAKNNDTGKVEKGYFAAYSKLDVHSFLLSEDYEVYEITPSNDFTKRFKFLQPKFSSNELDFFLTQLSTFLKSGITLIDSVKILSKQSKAGSHKQIYKSVIYELTMGENFSEALSKQGNVFPRLLVNMIKTSELTGDLPETLDDMADYYKETEKTKKQMISAITYPSVILVFAIGILIFIMVGVIPQFVSIYGNMGNDLPAITVIIINISNFLQKYWMYVIIVFFGFILLFIILYKTIKVFKTVIQSLLMHLPVMGKIMIYNEVTMFTKTFASLLNHNVYITDCMEVLSKITNNEIYKMLIFDTITNLARGDAISNSFKNHWAFPAVAYEMILTGEKTGQLGTMMDKVAGYYQEQHNNAVNQIKAFIEPVMIVVLAAIVGIVLLSVVLPMFDMYQNLS